MMDTEDNLNDNCVFLIYVSYFFSFQAALVTHTISKMSILGKILTTLIMKESRLWRLLLETKI